MTARSEGSAVCDGGRCRSMTTWMALFGLVWLLRVRGSLCGCAACKRVRQEHDASTPTARALSPDERAPFDVIALESYTRDVTVQTDFDDEEVEDLDKIELQITEECKYTHFNLPTVISIFSFYSYNFCVQI